MMRFVKKIQTRQNVKKNVFFHLSASCKCDFNKESSALLFMLRDAYSSSSLSFTRITGNAGVPFSIIGPEIL